MDELLALLGQNWRLLLLYPGGLTTLGALIVLGSLLEGRRWWTVVRLSLTKVILITAGWMLLIALLPLPQTGWPYGLDVLSLVLLIELPYWGHTTWRGETSTAWMAARLNSYPLLALAIAAVGQAAGSLVVRDINRSTGLLHWFGVVLWSLIMPPLLGLGPWRVTHQPTLLHTMRQLTHVALLLAVTMPAHDATPVTSAVIGFMSIVLPFATLHRWWRGDSNTWIRWQPWLVAASGLLLTFLSAHQLFTRFG